MLITNAIVLKDLVIDGDNLCIFDGHKHRSATFSPKWSVLLLRLDRVPLALQLLTYLIRDGWLKFRAELSVQCVGIDEWHANGKLFSRVVTNKKRKGVT